jgi:cytochrome c biogenesis protein ResB
MVRDYVSEIEVVADPCLQHAGAGGEVVASKDIEVNHPLHWGGYRFYQSSYDDKEGKFTVLQVVSDTGLAIVWFGYALLCLGVFVQMWGKLAKPQKTNVTVTEAKWRLSGQSRDC